MSVLSQSVVSESVVTRVWRLLMASRLNSTSASCTAVRMRVVAKLLVFCVAPVLASWHVFTGWAGSFSSFYGKTGQRTPKLISDCHWSTISSLIGSMQVPCTVWVRMGLGAQNSVWWDRAHVQECISAGEASVWCATALRMIETLGGSFVKERESVMGVSYVTFGTSVYQIGQWIAVHHSWLDFVDIRRSSLFCHCPHTNRFSRWWWLIFLAWGGQCHPQCVGSHSWLLPDSSCCYVLLSLDLGHYRVCRALFVGCHAAARAMM